MISSGEFIGLSREAAQSIGRAFLEEMPASGGNWAGESPMVVCTDGMMPGSNQCLAKINLRKGDANNNKLKVAVIVVCEHIAQLLGMDIVCNVHEVPATRCKKHVM